MVITLSKGIPNNADPIAALGGNAKDWFSWTYDQDTTTYTATQIATIPAASRETLTIDYLLNEVANYCVQALDRQPMTVAELADLVAREFAVEAAQARVDVTAFLEQMRAEQAIESVADANDVRS